MAHDHHARKGRTHEGNGKSFKDAARLTGRARRRVARSIARSAQADADAGERIERDRRHTAAWDAY